MALRPVDITAGQVSGVDDLSSAPSFVSNWEVDEAGINRPRPRNTDLTLTGLDTTVPIIGHTYWPGQGGHLVMVNENGEIYTASDSVPGTAFLRSDASANSATRCEGSSPQVTFVHGKDHVYIARGGVGGGITRWTPSEGLADRILQGVDKTHIASIGRRIAHVNFLGDRNLFAFTDAGEGTWGTSLLATDKFNEPDSRPDPIQGLYDNGSELFVFGTQTLQVYGVGLDPLLPFEPLNAMNVGCAAPFLATRRDQDFAFVDHNRNVAITDGRGLEVIGDAIKSTLAGLDYIDDGFMWREVRDQYSVIGLRFPTEARTFTYDEKGKRWSEMQDYDGNFLSGHRLNSYAYWPKYNQHTFSSTTGGMFRRGVSGGDGIVCRRVTGWQDHGSVNRKRSTRIRLVFRRGTAAEGATPGAVEIRVQNQDGPWSQWKQVSVGEPSDYDQARDLFFGGVFKRRRYDVRFSTAENMSLVGLYDDVEELAA